MVKPSRRAPDAGSRSANDLWVVDDFAPATGESVLGTRWEAHSDQVMGGRSTVRASSESHDRPHLRLQGEVATVSPAGEAGFVTASLELGKVDASSYTGVKLVVRGNGQRYQASLRTPFAIQPWQSWRASFVAPLDWTPVLLPFAAFRSHRIDVPLDVSKLRRISLGRAGELGPVDLRVAFVAFYEQPAP